MSNPHELKRLHQVAVHVEDLAVSKYFYADVLGAKFIAEFNPPGLVFFDFQGVRLLLEHGTQTGTLYFRVEDIDKSVEHFQSKGVVFDELPHVIFKDETGLFGPKGFEELLAFFKDPAGNILALAAQRAPG